MPRAYWLDPKDQVLTSSMILLQPSQFEFNRISTAISNAGPSDYDMEIMNKLYKTSALVIPHRPYILLTGEFHATTHHAYLGNAEESWDPLKSLKEAKYIHFSDWPVPKVSNSTASLRH